MEELKCNYSTNLTTKYTKILVADEPAYNTNHRFSIVNASTHELLTEINFQKGPIKECGVNGVHNEDLIHIVIKRLEDFQCSDYRCSENAEAIDYLYKALDSLRSRTNKRAARGVEGTSAV